MPAGDVIPQALLTIVAAATIFAVMCGLALLVAALNNAHPEIGRTVLAYFVVAALTVLPYVIWRRREGRPQPAGVNER